MILGRYRLAAQLSSGPDGVSYRAAEARGDAPVELRVLSGARAEADRWRLVARRLRLAAMLEHPIALAVRELCLEHDSPYVVLEEMPTASLASSGPDTSSELPGALRLFGALCDALSAAHRLGLAHGKLCPAAVRLADGRRPKLDFTGLEVEAVPPPGTGVGPDACRAPELLGDRPADPPADVFSLAALLTWLLNGGTDHARRGRVGVPAPRALNPPLSELLGDMLALDPAERPSAGEVLERLSAGAECDIPRPNELERTVLMRATARTGVPHTLPNPLGRFRLLEKLGEGGFGEVYRAEDVTDGTVVAIKILHPQLADRPDVVRRFHKEARLLAEVNNPYVARLIESNEDGEVRYLALEFVAGQNLGGLLAQRGRLDEPLAVAILADVARGLVAAHQRGIIHRDIKPNNIVLADPVPGNGPPQGLGVKLIDFGLARHIVETASLQLTQEGAVVGTARYMSPEQAAGDQPLDPRSDVYSLGATLFHLLTGRPPFLADTALRLSMKHASEPLPSLQQLNPNLSDGICRVAEKALAKQPDQRYADAEAFLLDLERLRRGEPTSILVHPLLPTCPPGRLLSYDWTWELEAAPEQLWPYVSNTDRLNRAVGIPAVQFTRMPDPGGGVQAFGRFTKAGFTNVWREHPFEWVEGRRMGVLREYSQGVFKWLATTTELRSSGRGTTLTHSVRIEPAGLMGRLVAAVEVARKGRRLVERVYRRIDAYLTGGLAGRPDADPFEEPAGRPRLRRRLEPLLDRLVRAGVEPGVALALGEFLAEAPSLAVARIRPLALARRLGLDPEALTAACLVGAREGLLVLLWDLLCPVCRIPAAITDTLRALAAHAHCPACDLDFELDFANSVEMIFRVHPQVRPSDLGTYCIGGPFHSPHVAAQVRLAPGERVELEMALPEGAYRVRGPQLPRALDFRAGPSASATRWDLPLGRAGAIEPPEPLLLRAGRQLLVLTSEFERELLVRVERTVQRADALTAARASSLALFRELFPLEVLSPGQLVSVSAVTLLVTDLDRAADLYASLGDARAFALLQEHFQAVRQCIARAGGAVVKTVGEGVVATFNHPVAAVRAGLALLNLERSGPPLGLRVGAHRGPVLAANLSDHLDFFGATVNEAHRLPQLLQGGQMVLTEPVVQDPEVAGLLRARGLAVEVLPAALPGPRSGILHRVVPPTA